MISEDDNGIEFEFQVTWGCFLVILACIAVWGVAIGATARALGVL